MERDREGGRRGEKEEEERREGWEEGINSVTPT